MSFLFQIIGILFLFLIWFECWIGVVKEHLCLVPTLRVTMMLVAFFLHFFNGIEFPFEWKFPFLPCYGFIKIMNKCLILSSAFPPFFLLRWITLINFNKNFCVCVHEKYSFLLGGREADFGVRVELGSLPLLLHFLKMFVYDLGVISFLIFNRISQWNHLGQ